VELRFSGSAGVVHSPLSEERKSRCCQCVLRYPVITDNKVLQFHGCCSVLFGITQQLEKENGGPLFTQGTRKPTDKLLRSYLPREDPYGFLH